MKYIELEEINNMQGYDRHKGDIMYLIDRGILTIKEMKKNGRTRTKKD